MTESFFALMTIVLTTEKHIGEAKQLLFYRARLRNYCQKKTRQLCFLPRFRIIHVIQVYFGIYVLEVH